VSFGAVPANDNTSMAVGKYLQEAGDNDVLRGGKDLNIKFILGFLIVGIMGPQVHSSLEPSVSPDSIVVPFQRDLSSRPCGDKLGGALLRQGANNFLLSTSTPSLRPTSCCVTCDGVSACGYCVAMACGECCVE
jgi:hypothetical protein